MCKSVSTNEEWTARNGCVVVTKYNRSDGSIGVVVVAGSTPEFPVGYETTYMSSMGHVLCVGDDGDDDRQDTCKIHPLDAEREILDRTHVKAALKILKNLAKVPA